MWRFCGAGGEWSRLALAASGRAKSTSCAGAAASALRACSAPSAPCPQRTGVQHSTASRPGQANQSPANHPVPASSTLRLPKHLSKHNSNPAPIHTCIQYSASSSLRRSVSAVRVRREERCSRSPTKLMMKLGSGGRGGKTKERKGKAVWRGRAVDEECSRAGAAWRPAPGWAGAPPRRPPAARPTPATAQPPKRPSQHGPAASNQTPLPPKPLSSQSSPTQSRRRQRPGRPPPPAAPRA